MSTDRDTTRIVRSWLRTGEHESADRVLDAVLDQIDTTPQRDATWWPARRFPHMNNAAKLALTAAAVVLVALVGIRYLAPEGTNLGGPNQKASPSPASDADEAALRAWVDAVNRGDRDALEALMVDRPVTDVRTVDREEAISYVLDEWCPLTITSMERGSGDSFLVDVTFQDNADSTCVAGTPGGSSTIVIEVRDGKVSRIP